MVEQPAVNRLVVGSNPTSGANFKRPCFKGFSSKGGLAREPVSADLPVKKRLLHSNVTIRA
jgi:hypothetical protein